jgi:hypothetical protein
MGGGVILLPLVQQLALTCLPSKDATVAVCLDVTKLHDPQRDKTHIASSER